MNQLAMFDDPQPPRTAPIVVGDHVWVELDDGPHIRGIVSVITERYVCVAYRQKVGKMWERHTITTTIDRLTLSEKGGTRGVG